MWRCAVAGQPIAHSLSPLIHTTAYLVLGIEGSWEYDRVELDAAGLPGFVAGCGPEWVGLSCTAPLKHAVLGLGTASPQALLLDSGNTLVFAREGRPARVENTDVTGMLGALARAGVTAAERAILVGNGATARSALAALADLGVTRVRVLVRSRANAEASLAGLADRLGILVDYGPWGVEGAGGQADLLISTVSAPLPDPVAASLAGEVPVCFDATYNHYPTALDRAARAAGIVQLSGIDLLVGQALDQIRLFTGRECPPEPLLEAAYAALP